jgi:uncharacterized protein
LKPDRIAPAAVAPVEAELERWLYDRFGRPALDRLAIERHHDAHARDLISKRWLHLEEWYRAPRVIRGCLWLVGLLRRARRNALAFRVVENELPIAGLDAAFDGFRILHLTDLHVDINDAFVPRLIEQLRGIDYDACVLTGDYRAKTFGPIDETIDGMRRLRAALADPIYAVLGNHDSIRFVPAFESFGISTLVNETVILRRDKAALRVVGIDDAHWFRLDDIPHMVTQQPRLPSLLLSHTPETYLRAEAAGFDAMLCGHTHGGQICLPGGYAITLDARIPRRLGRGAWRHGRMQGYTSPGVGTSIVDARLNCPPEITLHRLRAA